MADEPKRPDNFKKFYERQLERSERVANITMAALPFTMAEWCFEWVDYGLKNIAFFDVLSRLAQLSILAVAVGLWQSWTERDVRVENERKQRQYQAWQVVNTGLAAGGSGGRVDALQDLHRDGVSLRNVKLTGAVLDGMDLRPVGGRPAFLIQAMMDSASLVDVRLTHAILTAVKLTRSRLSRAQLDSADLFAADLTGAYLINASLTGATLTNANLTGAALMNANLTGAYLLNANLTGASLGDANLTEANLNEADFTGADLHGAYLSGAQLNSANLTHTFLQGAQLDGAGFSGAKLVGANLLGADLTGARLRRAGDLSRANLYSVMNPDTGAIATAIRDGAVCVDDSEAFRRMVIGEIAFPAPPATPEEFERECAVRRPG